MIALCRVLSPGEEGEEWAKNDDIPVLFSGPNAKPDMELEIEEGTEVSVCKPYSFVDLPEPGIPIVISASADERMSTGLTQFGMRVGKKAGGTGKGDGKKALLCSRYFLR